MKINKKPTITAVKSNYTANKNIQKDMADGINATFPVETVELSGFNSSTTELSFDTKIEYSVKGSKIESSLQSSLAGEKKSKANQSELAAELKGPISTEKFQEIDNNLRNESPSYEYLWLGNAPAPFRWTGSALYKTGHKIYDITQEDNIRDNLYSVARAGRYLGENARTLEDVSTAVSSAGSVGGEIMFHTLTGLAAIGGTGLIIHGVNEAKAGRKGSAASAFLGGTASIAEATSGIMSATGILGTGGVAAANALSAGASALGYAHGTMEIGLGGIELYNGIKDKDQDKIVNGALKAGIGGALIGTISTGSVVPALAGLGMIGAKLLYNHKKSIVSGGKKIKDFFKKDKEAGEEKEIKKEEKEAKVENN